MRFITTSTILGTTTARQGIAIAVDGNCTSTLRHLCNLSADFARGLSLSSYRLANWAERLLTGLSPQPAMCMSHRSRQVCRRPVGVAVKRVVGQG